MKTLKQAAEIIGTTPDNLRGAIVRGTLKAEKVGRDWLVADAEVDRYRTQHSRAGRVQAAAELPWRGRGRPRKVDPQALPGPMG